MRVGSRTLFWALIVTLLLTLATYALTSPRSQTLKELIALSAASGVGKYVLSPHAGLDAAGEVRDLKTDGLSEVRDHSAGFDFIDCGTTLQRVDGYATFDRAGSWPIDRFSYSINLQIDDNCRVLSAIGYARPLPAL